MRPFGNWQGGSHEPKRDIPILLPFGESEYVSDQTADSSKWTVTYRGTAPLVVAFGRAMRSNAAAINLRQPFSNVRAPARPPNEQALLALE